MVQVWFPGLTIPEFSMKRGSIMDVWLLGINLAIPAWDLTFWRAIKIWDPFLLFDTDWIVTPLKEAVDAAASALVGFVTGVEPRISDLIGGVAPTIESFLTGVETRISSAIAGVGPAIERFLAGVETRISGLIAAIPEAVWNFARTTLDQMAADYYERHSEEGE